MIQHFSLENNFRQCLLGEAAAIAEISDHINMTEIVKAIGLLGSCQER